jgi:hypothetical protein
MDIATYEKTTLLLPLNGANDGVLFPDYSPQNLTVTAYGNAATKTAQYKYYDSSAYFDGTGDYLGVANDGNICNFGTGDFYIGLWVYRVGNNALQGIIDPRPGVNGNYPVMYIASNNTVNWYVGTTNVITGGTVMQNTWVLIEAERISGVTKLYLDGAQTGSSWTDATSYLANATSLIIGKTYDNYYFTGCMQDIQIAFEGATGRSTKLTGTISNAGSGVAAVKDDADAAAIRSIYATPRTETIAARNFITQSDANGRYSLQVPMTTCNVIFEDDAAGTQYADILVSHVTPT